MKRHMIALLPLAAFVLLVGLFAAPLLRGQDPSRLESAMIGRTIPAFVLPSALPGQQSVTDAHLKGQPAVVNFFASWCVPCQAEQPTLTHIAAADGIAIIGIAYKDKPQDTTAWLAKHGNPFRATGADMSGRVAIEWGVYGVPETFVIDRAGIIRYRHVGPLTQQVYQDTVKPLLAEVMK